MRTGLKMASTGMSPIGASVLRLVSRSDVALPALDRHLHRDLGPLVEGADHVVGVEHLDVVAGLDLAGGDLAGAARAQLDLLGALAVHP